MYLVLPVTFRKLLDLLWDVCVALMQLSHFKFKNNNILFITILFNESFVITIIHFTYNFAVAFSSYLRPISWPVFWKPHIQAYGPKGNSRCPSISLLLSFSAIDYRKEYGRTMKEFFWCRSFSAFLYICMSAKSISFPICTC